MQHADRFGLELTAESSPAVEDYVAAVDLLLSANAGAEARLDQALAADPKFALAHIAKARLYQVHARIPEAKEAAAKARELAGRVTSREARHIETIALAVDGNGPGALALLEEHIADYPRDGLALSLALGVFGLLGFSGRIDHHEAQLARSNGWRRIGAMTGGFSPISAGRGSSWTTSGAAPPRSSARSKAIRATPLPRMPAPMVISRRATRKAAPALSRRGCRTTPARASCIATSPGI
ncbi:MAG TPA: hypothetical protein VGR70_02610 [Stellaceae bacterium]|nr:hypothetical protein [Stellaceae bacterium]